MKLGPYEVTIKESLTWGDVQKVQAVLASGAKIGSSGLTGYDPSAMTEAKYTLLEIGIVKITDSNTVIPFTRDWMNNLSVEDGDTLYDAVDALSKKK